MCHISTIYTMIYIPLHVYVYHCHYQHAHHRHPHSHCRFTTIVYCHYYYQFLLSLSIILIIRGIFHQIPSLLFLVLSSLSSSRSFVRGGGGKGGGGGGCYGCCRTRLSLLWFWFDVMAWTGFAGRTNFAEFIHKDSNPNHQERYHQKHKLIVT